MRYATSSLIAAAVITLAACGGTAPETPPAAPATPQSVATVPSGAADGVFKNVGNHHHPIETTNSEAQKFVDQGFNFTFGFNHEEAARSFKKASELDPKAAMAHWGVAWAMGPNYNLDIDDERAKQAYTAMQQALTLSAGGSVAERAYIEAMAIRFSPDPKADRAALARRYADRMRDVVRRFPDDLDAATLYAESLMNLRPWKLWSLDGKPADGTQEIVAVLESVLARDPESPRRQSLLHPYGRSVDRAGASTAERGPSRDAGAWCGPSRAHARARLCPHGRSRGRGTGQYRLAPTPIASTSRWAPPMASTRMAYYSHNLHFLTDSEMMQGRFAAAKDRR